MLGLIFHKIPYPDYELSFSSKLFESYRGQVGSLFDKIDLPDVRERFFQEATDASARRKVHENFIYTLRMECNREAKTTREAVERLSAALFKKADLVDDYIELMTGYADLSDEALSYKPLDELLFKIQHRVDDHLKSFSHVPIKKGFKDHQLHGFLPSRLFTTGQTHHLYLPNPTIFDKKTEIKTLNPLFLAYLDHLREKGHRHLYINAKPMRTILLDLAKDERYRDTLALISLDRESTFYLQEQGKSNANQFIEEFEIHLFGDDKYFFWPEHWLGMGWHYKVVQLIEKTHRDFFDSKQYLTKQERGAFIEIVYAEIVLAACEIIQPRFANVTCEYTMDRAPTLFAFIYLYNHLKNFGDLGVEEKRRFLTMLFFSPIIVNGRAAKDFRIARLENTLEVVLKRRF